MVIKSRNDIYRQVSLADCFKFVLKLHVLSWFIFRVIVCLDFFLNHKSQAVALMQPLRTFYDLSDQSHPIAHPDLSSILL